MEDNVLAVIGTVIAVATILNTLSRWSAVREVVSRYQDKEITRLTTRIHQLAEMIHSMPHSYVLKSDHHEDMKNLWNAIDRKREIK